MRREWWLLGGVIGLALVLGPRLLAPVRGRITSRFQEADRPDHNGTDVAVPTGTPVVSPGPGLVAFSNWNDRGGNQVGVLLDNGLTVGLAHLSARAVNPGQRVERGQVLGRSGDTGHVTGPHVHVTVTNSSGEKIDPESIFNLTA